ncbi:hypothetical protein [Lacticaseibacillus paracasei]|uniref:hypothetical protein n=1 Tax=Lacticaseibacillus paracasei TaxID=1597 RepID=UPI0022E163CD|nr:hypothetical protein [Lacticaseibacillus paracasei]
MGFFDNLIRHAKSLETNKSIKNLAIQKTSSEVRPNTKIKKSPQTVRKNPNTGFPMAKETSIQRAREMYKQTISILKYKPSGNKKLDYEMAIIDEVLPHYHLGDLYYKEGDWVKAENEWLSIVKKMGQLSANKLAVMYHKEKHFKDEIAILKDGFKYSVHNKVYPISDKDLVSERISKATIFLTAHIDQDKSVGYKLK